MRKLGEEPWVEPRTLSDNSPIIAHLHSRNRSNHHQQFFFILTPYLSKYASLENLRKHRHVCIIMHKRHVYAWMHAHTHTRKHIHGHTNTNTHTQKHTREC